MRKVVLEVHPHLCSNVATASMQTDHCTRVSNIISAWLPQVSELRAKLLDLFGANFNKRILRLDHNSIIM